MYIKSINNVVGYKDLPDGFCANFDEETTYIIGANFQRKTTVGSLFNWCLTGTSLYGKEKEQVANDKIKNSNVIVDMTFVDNHGIEHRLIRDKGKEMNLILDGKEIKQEMLAQYYINKDLFLVAHNPYYFYSLEPKEQKELLRKIVPSIAPKIAFNFLTPVEQKIIGGPIDLIDTYTDKRNEEINELKNEYNRNLGQLQAYEKVALNQEGEILKFENEQELEQLQKRYEEISMDFGASNLEDIQKSINAIDEQLYEIFQIKLANIKKQYAKENEKLNNFCDKKSICFACRQEIKDSESKNNLINFQKKELKNLQKKANDLKDEATRLMNRKNEKLEIFEKLKTIDVEKLFKEKAELKERIDLLQKEKNNIIIHNKEVQTRQEQVREAKNKIELIKTVQEEIKIDIEKSNLQKKIANKLKVLIIEKQQEKINKYLNKVSIQFSKINKTNDKVVECCDIQYEGRDYKKLSKSQQVRACLELSNAFNNLSRIKAPIFLDDAESTTDIESIPNTQMIISMVIKYNPLEIVYDYEDVLDRKRKSLDREIKERSGYLEQAA